MYLQNIFFFPKNKVYLPPYHTLSRQSKYSLLSPLCYQRSQLIALLGRWVIARVPAEIDIRQWFVVFIYPSFWTRQAGTKRCIIKPSWRNGFGSWGTRKERDSSVTARSNRRNRWRERGRKTLGRRRRKFFFPFEEKESCLFWPLVVYYFQGSNLTKGAPRHLR